jgi:plasmid maintenance system antidote protein VapI
MTLRAWLDEHGLTVDQVATATGLGRRQLFDVAAGRQRITRRQVERFVRVYGASPQAFGPVDRGPGRRWHESAPS